MKRNQKSYFIGTVFLAIFVILGFFVFFNNFKQELWLNIYSNLIFLVLAIFIIDKKNNDHAYKQLIERLASDMGGQSNEFAKKAVRELKRLGMDDDSHELIERDYNNANLEKADLSFMNLNGSDFSFANLKKVKMLRSKLISANLAYADLSSSWIDGGTIAHANLNNSKLIGANLNLTNCRFANFSNANLENAWLPKTNLENANFSGANLKNAVFEDAKVDNVIFSTKTIMPNGKKWKPGVKLMPPKKIPEVLNQD